MPTKAKPKVHKYCGQLDCKQCWEEYKLRNHEQQRTERKEGRGTIIPREFAVNRGARLHDCSHTLKKHKASGGCRKGCECNYAADRAERKRKARGA